MIKAYSLFLCMFNYQSHLVAFIKFIFCYQFKFQFITPKVKFSFIFSFRLFKNYLICFQFFLECSQTIKRFHY